MERAEATETNPPTTDFPVAAGILSGLGLATMPAWRGLVLGASPTIEDLLRIRCPA